MDDLHVSSDSCSLTRASNQFSAASRTEPARIGFRLPYMVSKSKIGVIYKMN